MRQNKVGELKLYKRCGHSSLLVFIILVCSVVVSELSAEDFEDFRRDQSSTFKNYKEENDRTFLSYLKSDWEAFSLEKPFSGYKDKKLREISSARNNVMKKQGPRVNIEIQKKKINLKVLTQVVVKKDINFDFFGTPIAFNIPQGMEKAKFYPQSQEGVSAYFDTVVLSPYEFLIENIKQISNDLNLNDWGKYMLITKLSDSIFVNEDESRLLSWFIFNKLGYAVRVGLRNRHIVVMYNSEKTIYATPNYNIAKKKFYIFSNYIKGNVGKVFTYKQNYPEANKSLDLSMKSLPKFAQKTMEKTLNFMQYGKRYKIKYTYNQNLIDFMATYPQADYETFFNAPLEYSSYRDIATALKKYINSKQASVALNFVLNFVQSAFQYEVDSQQFGREKVMFAQETLYYDKSDCEDRSILFSYLVKELFAIDVVGVKYKDHMATALYIPVKGDGVKVHNAKYIIADPTYINASIGQSMPKYRKVKPDSFIFLKRKKG